MPSNPILFECWYNGESKTGSGRSVSRIPLNCSDLGVRSPLQEKALLSAQGIGGWEQSPYSWIDGTPIQPQPAKPRKPNLKGIISGLRTRSNGKPQASRSVSRTDPQRRLFSR